MRLATGAHVVLLVWIAGSLIVLPAVGSALTHTSTGPDSVGESALAAQSTIDGENNTTKHHEILDQPATEGNIRAVQGWLAGRMSAKLEDCSVSLGVGTTDVCELEDQYPDWANKYVDVAEETDRDDDNRAAGTFQETADNHRQLAESVTEFQRTLAEYREAQANGNETRARQLARRLQRLASDTNRTSTEIIEDYITIDETTDVDLSKPKSRIRQLQQNYTTIVTEIETELFITTNLTATLSSPRVSFKQPVTVTGDISTETDTPLSNRQIALELGHRTFQIRTNATGGFSFQYRPTTLSLSTEHLVLRYVPRNESSYTGSELRLPVTVEQTSPNVSVSATPNRVGFGETLRISGTVSATEIGADAVPVILTLSGERLGRVETDRSGQFSLDTRIPSDVASGEARIRASVPLVGRALASANATTGITVSRTETTLSLAVSSTNSRTVEITGRLLTAGGRAVPDQSIGIGINGTTIETVTTSEDGSYTATVTIPDRLIPESTVATVMLTGQFDGENTNLLSSRTTETAQLNLSTASPDDKLSQGTVVSWILISLIVVLSLGGAYWEWGTNRYLSFLPIGRSNDSSTEETASDTTATETGPEQSVNANRSPLEQAHKSVEAGDADRAIVITYTVIRQYLSTEYDGDEMQTATHWEFYDTCRANGLNQNTLDSLRQLTEAYEQAAFAPYEVADDTATNIIADISEAFNLAPAD